MKEIQKKELDRLTERKFVPSSLVAKDSKIVVTGDQLYDSIELMLKYSHWQDVRHEKMSRLEACTPESELLKTERNLSTMKKISHAFKHERIISLPDNSKLGMMESESAGHCPSEMTSEDGRGNEQYSSL